MQSSREIKGDVPRLSADERPELVGRIAEIERRYKQKMLSYIRRKLNPSYSGGATPEDVWQLIWLVLAKKPQLLAECKSAVGLLKNIANKQVLKIVEGQRAQERNPRREQSADANGESGKVIEVARGVPRHVSQSDKKRVRRRSGPPADAPVIRIEPDSSAKLSSIHKHLHPSRMSPGTFMVLKEEVDLLVSPLPDSLRQIARLLLQNMGNKEIAAELRCNASFVSEGIQLIRDLWMSRGMIRDEPRL
jgi:hypothetical protein